MCRALEVVQEQRYRHRPGGALPKQQTSMPIWPGGAYEECALESDLVKRKAIDRGETRGRGGAVIGWLPAAGSISPGLLEQKEKTRGDLEIMLRVLQQHKKRHGSAISRLFPVPE